MIEGDQVVLRALRPADYPRLTEFRNDVEFALLGGDLPRPVTLAMVTEGMEELSKDSSTVNFAIEVGGVYIGGCSLFNLDQTAGTAELSIGIGDRDYQGRGHGREAVSLLVDYGFRLMHLRKIWLRASADNERAIRSYQAVGFVQEGRQREHAWANGRHVDVVLMALFAADFAAAGGAGTAAGPDTAAGPGQ